MSLSTTIPSALERRRGERDRRFLERVRLACAVRESAPGHLRMGQADDISMGGMRFRAVGPPPDRGPITLTFELPDWGALITVNARVVSGGDSTSVAFIALRESDAKLISLYVAGAPDRDPAGAFRVAAGG